jgi:hypothetical protein
MDKSIETDEYSVLRGFIMAVWPVSATGDGYINTNSN